MKIYYQGYVRAKDGSLIELPEKQKYRNICQRSTEVAASVFEGVPVVKRIIEEIV